MLNVQRMLKNMDDTLFYKTLKIAELTNEEYVIIREFVLRGKPREEVIKSLHISLSTFNIIKNKALIKIRCAISNAVDEKINHLA